MKKIISVIFKIVIGIMFALGFIMMFGKPVVEANNYDKWIFRFGNAIPFFIFAFCGIIFEKMLNKKNVFKAFLAVFLAFALSIASNIFITNFHSNDYQEKYKIYRLDKEKETEKIKENEEIKKEELQDTVDIDVSNTDETLPTEVPTTQNISTTKPTTTESQTETTTQLQKQLMFIPGCNSYDIMLSIEDRFGIKKPSPVENHSGNGYSFSNFDNDFEYIIYTHDNLNDVIMVDFSYSNYNQNKNDFIESAKMYLGYAATIPYDTAQQKEAKEWVVSNISNVKPGNTVEKVFGDALYRLNGNIENGIIDLEISVYPFPY